MWGGRCVLSSLSTLVLLRGKHGNLLPKVDCRTLYVPRILKAGHLKPRALVFFLMYHSVTGWRTSELPHCCDEIPSKNTWEEEGFTLAQCERTVSWGEEEVSAGARGQTLVTVKNLNSI